MYSFTPKDRLEKEIKMLINFIVYGRELWYEQTGFTRESSKEYYDHFQCQDLFYSNELLIQTDLNIQLLYIKLSSYNELLPREQQKKQIKFPRAAFAHANSDLIFNGRFEYNYFLHKVSEDFSRFMYLFYTLGETEKETQAVELDLDEDIKRFISLIKIDT